MIKIDDKQFFAKIATGFLVVAVLTIPLFFFPFTNDLIDFPKRMVIFWIAALLVILWGMRTIKTKFVEWTRTIWTIPVVAFGCATAASIIFTSPNKTMAIIGMGGLYIALCFLFITLTSLIQKSVTQLVLNSMVIGGLIISLIAILDQVGIHLAVILNALFNLKINPTTWVYLTGSALFTVFFLVIVLATLIARFVFATPKQKPLLATLGAVVLIGIFIAAVRISPGKTEQPQFLSTLDSWSIVTDVYKSPKNLFLGIGTDSYPSAFSIFKPRSLNDTPLWFVHFGSARDIFLEIMVTHGILGVTTLLVIFALILRYASLARKENIPLVTGVAVASLILLFFPPNSIVVPVFFILLAAWAIALKAEHSHTKEVIIALVARSSDNAQGTNSTVQSLHIAAIVASVAFVVASVIGIYVTGKAFGADIWYNSALVASTKNNAQQTYTSLQQAILLNPYNPLYRRTFSLTSLALTRSLANLSKTQKLTEQQQSIMVNLIQQSIDQAKIATTLDPIDSINWETLTSVYQSLIGAVDQADQWTEAALAQEIVLDPQNPQLRLSLGMLYRDSNNPDQAVLLFEQAIQSKPDYANAYYNLADMYGRRGDIATQLALLQKTLSLLQPSQPDYKTVANQVAQLQKQVQEKESTKTQKQTTTSLGTQEVTQQQPITTAKKIKLPVESGVASASAVPTVSQ